MAEYDRFIDWLQVQFPNIDVTQVPPDTFRGSETYQEWVNAGQPTEKIDISAFRAPRETTTTNEQVGQPMSYIVVATGQDEFGFPVDIVIPAISWGEANINELLQNVMQRDRESGETTPLSSADLATAGWDLNTARQQITHAVLNTELLNRGINPLTLNQPEVREFLAQTSTFQSPGSDVFMEGVLRSLERVEQNPAQAADILSELAVVPEVEQAPLSQAEVAGQRRGTQEVRDVMAGIVNRQSEFASEQEYRQAVIEALEPYEEEVQGYEPRLAGFGSEGETRGQVMGYLDVARTRLGEIEAGGGQQFTEESRLAEEAEREAEEEEDLKRQAAVKPVQDEFRGLVKRTKRRRKTTL